MAGRVSPVSPSSPHRSSWTSKVGICTVLYVRVLRDNIARMRIASGTACLGECLGAVWVMSQTGFKRVGGLVVGKAGADPVRGPGHCRYLDQPWVDSVIRALSRPRQCESSASSAACEGSIQCEREGARRVCACVCTAAAKGGPTEACSRYL